MTNSTGSVGDDDGGAPAAASGPLTWTDVRHRAWSVSLSARGLSLRDGERVVEIPAERWERDLYIAEHGSGYIVRVETFECAIGFALSAEQASPLIVRAQSLRAESQPIPDAVDEPPADQPLLWPKVSPLAVWALMCSALAFVPVLGLIPALATVALLVIHRRQVRRSAAYRHSRGLCTAALVVLALGLVVSAIGMWGLSVNAKRAGHPQRPYMRRAADRPKDHAVAPASRATVEQTPVAPTRVSQSPTAQPRAARSPVAQSSIADRDHNWGLIAAAMVVVLLSLTVHEAAHAVSAWWLGDDFARRLGRVTLNPLAHMDPVGTILLPLVLFLAGAGVFGWARPVPVRLDHVARPRRAHILISLAGPGSNLLLAAMAMMLLIGVCGVVGIVAPGATLVHLTTLDFTNVVSASGFVLAPVVGPLCTILKLTFLVNVFLAFFNLIPIPPLDGSWVLEHLFPRALGPLYDRIRPFAFLLFLGLIYSNVLTHLLTPAWIALATGLELLRSCTVV